MKNSLNRILSLTPLLVIALFTACVPFLQPLYTADTTVFREELIGVWKEKPADEDSWIFTKAENNSYSLLIEEKDASAKFQARLVKLGDHLFLDLFPDGASLENARIGDFYKASLVPGHLIMKVKLGAKLELQLLEPDRLKEQLATAPESLAHTFVESDRLVITATTADLQKFFRKHATTASLWGDPGSMQKLVL